MKVCQLTCVYPPYGGGIGKVAYHYARCLAERHEVTVITPQYNKTETFASLAEVRVEPFKPWFSLGKAAWLPTIVQRLRSFDVVHLHYPFFGIHEYLAKLPRPQKLIISFHMLARANGLKEKIFQIDRKLTALALARRADLLLCATHDYMHEAGLPTLGEADKWQVLPFGVDECYQPAVSPSLLRRRYNVKQDEALLLFVGTLDKAHAFKGLDVLFASLASLKGKAWRLLVVGTGDLKNHYILQAQNLGLAKWINFVGFIKDSELPEYYHAADMFLFPSISTAEAFGLAALQAMACGLPVIASRLPGVRELVRDGEAGLLVEPGSVSSLAAAIESLLNDPAKARGLGHQGAILAKAKYQWSKIGQELLAIYSKIL